MGRVYSVQREADSAVNLPCCIWLRGKGGEPALLWVLRCQFPWRLAQREGGLRCPRSHCSRAGKASQAAPSHELCPTLASYTLCRSPEVSMCWRVPSQPWGIRKLLQSDKSPREPLLWIIQTPTVTPRWDTAMMKIPVMKLTESQSQCPENCVCKYLGCFSCCMISWKGISNFSRKA